MGICRESPVAIGAIACLGIGYTAMLARYMTIKEVSEYLRISTVTLYKYLRRGLIPAAKIGRHWRFDRETLDDWMMSQLRARGR